MANLAGQKTFLEIQQEVSENVLGNAVLADTRSNPTLTQVKRFINDAHREICSKRNWYFLYKEANFNLVKDQTTAHTLPDDVQELYGITIPSEEIRLGETSLDSFNRALPGRYTDQESGQPYSYVKAPIASNGAMQVYIWPAPQENYTARITYKARISNLSDPTDIPLIPPEWQDVLISLASGKAVMKKGSDNSNELAKVYYELYESRYADMWVHNEAMSEYIKGIVAEWALPVTGSVGNDILLWNIATNGK